MKTYMRFQFWKATVFFLFQKKKNKKRTGTEIGRTRKEHFSAGFFSLPKDNVSLSCNQPHSVKAELTRTFALFTSWKVSKEKGQEIHACTQQKQIACQADWPQKYQSHCGTHFHCVHYIPLRSEPGRNIDVLRLRKHVCVSEGFAKSFHARFQFFFLRPVLSQCNFSQQQETLVYHCLMLVLFRQGNFLPHPLPHQCSGDCHHHQGKVVAHDCPTQMSKIQETHEARNGEHGYYACYHSVSKQKTFQWFTLDHVCSVAVSVFYFLVRLLYLEEQVPGGYSSESESESFLCNARQLGVPWELLEKDSCTEDLVCRHSFLWHWPDEDDEQCDKYFP